MVVVESFSSHRWGIVQTGAAGVTEQDQGAVTARVVSIALGCITSPSRKRSTARRLRPATPIDRRERPGARAGRIGFFRLAAFEGVLFHFVDRPGG